MERTPSPPQLPRASSPPQSFLSPLPPRLHFFLPIVRIAQPEDQFSKIEGSDSSHVAERNSVRSIFTALDPTTAIPDSVAYQSLHDHIIMGLAGSKGASSTDESYVCMEAERQVRLCNNKPNAMRDGGPFHPLEVVTIKFKHRHDSEPENHIATRTISPPIERSRLFLMTIPNDDDENMNFLATDEGAQEILNLIKRLRRDFDEDMIELRANRAENMFIRDPFESILERLAKLRGTGERKLPYTQTANARNPTQTRYEAHGIAIYTELEGSNFTLRLVQTLNQYLFPGPIDHGVTIFHPKMHKRMLFRPTITEPMKYIIPYDDIQLSETDQITHILTTPLKRHLSYCLLHFEKSLRAGAQLVALPELTSMRSTDEERATSYQDVKAMFSGVADFSFDFFFFGSGVWTDPEHKGPGGQYGTTQQRVDCLEQWMSQLPELVKLAGGREKRVSVAVVGHPTVLQAWIPHRHWDTFELVRAPEGDDAVLRKRVWGEAEGEGEGEGEGEVEVEGAKRARQESGVVSGDSGDEMDLD